MRQVVHRADKLNLTIERKKCLKHILLVLKISLLFWPPRGVVARRENVIDVHTYSTIFYRGSPSVMWSKQSLRAMRCLLRQSVSRASIRGATKNYVLRKWRDPMMRRVFGFLDSYAVLDGIQPWLGGLGLILTFHHAEIPGRPVFDPGLNVYSDDLDRMLEYIRNREWDIISIDQLHSRLKCGKTPRPFVCFTFDDGYTDNLSIALPIFRRHEAPLCIYVAVGYTNRTTPGWWDALGEALLQRDYIEFAGDGQVEWISLATWDEKVKAYRRLAHAIHRDALAGRSPLGSTWSRNGLDPMALSDHSFLTWEQLQRIARDPLVQIGAQTVTHPSLANLSENEAGDEIEQSKRILEDTLGVGISHFAYPFGGYQNCGPREFRLARELGFRTAVTTRSCNIFPVHKEHLMSLPRKSLSADDAGVETVRGRLYGEDLSVRFWRRIGVE